MVALLIVCLTFPHFLNFSSSVARDAVSACSNQWVEVSDAAPPPEPLETADFAGRLQRSLNGQTRDIRAIPLAALPPETPTKQRLRESKGLLPGEHFFL